MAYHTEKGPSGVEELVIDGFDKGIAPSPHDGIADMKNFNINSLPGEASVNFNRVSTIPAISGGVFTQVNSTNVSSNSVLVAGSVVSIGTGITGLSSGVYWIRAIPGGIPIQYNLAASYNGPAVSGMSGGGTAIFNTPSTSTAEKFVAKAQEYVGSSGAYRYFIMGSLGHLWVSDPQIYSGQWTIVNPTGLANPTTGMAVSQGVVFGFANQSGGNQGIFWQFTNQLGNSWIDTSVLLNTPPGSSNPHYAITTPDKDGAIYYTDTNFIGQINGSTNQALPDTNGVTFKGEQFTLASATSNTSTSVTLNTLIQGSWPVTGLPVTFYPTLGGTLPGTSGTGSTGSLVAGTTYYLVAVNGSTFGIAATSGGAAMTINATSFFMTTFYPSGTMWTINRQEIALPYYEVAQCLEFISTGVSQIVIGTSGRDVYFWTIASSAQPTSLVSLPETNTHRILNVDNTLYIFAGSKGNIYISNGPNLAGALSVPDYIANPFGTNQNPWFVWGDCMFLLGRVWFSIQDQNAGNTTGNCGGVWSFTPTQNLFLGQDQGIQLHLENQNSYGTYNGLCDILIPSVPQLTNGPQYWSGWSSDYSSGSIGIDASGTLPYNTAQFAQIDSDIIPVGQYLKKYTPTNFEYKASRPLATGETVEIQIRPDLTSAFTSVKIFSTAGITSQPAPTTLQNMEWMQVRVKATSTASSPSYLPLTQLRIRP